MDRCGRFTLPLTRPQAHTTLDKAMSRKRLDVVLA